MRILLVRACGTVLALTCWAAWAAPTPAPLDTVAAVRSLTWQAAAESRPVHLTGIVTFYEPQQQNLFFQDATGSIYIEPTTRFPVVAGSRVEVWGTTFPGYSNQIHPDRIREISRGPLPAAPLVSYDDAASHENDCRFVALQGIVRSASVQSVDTVRAWLLQMDVDGRIVEIEISSFPGFDPWQLLDATVRVTGNLSGDFNHSEQILGLQLMVSDSSQMRVIGMPAVNPLHIPLTPLATLLRSDQTLFGVTRVRTQGIVTLYDPGERLVIRDGDSNLLVQTRQMTPLAIGQTVEVTGFPSSADGSPILKTAQFMPIGGTEHLRPSAISFADAMSGLFADHLVSLDGELISQTRERDLDTLTVRSDGQDFQAVIRKTPGQPDPLPNFQPGSRLRVSGVCMLHFRGFWRSVESFQIHMRSAQDISVLASAPWWTVRHMLYVTTAVLVLALVALGWGLWMRRRLLVQERLTRLNVELEAARLATVAELERQRSHILELINSFESLPDVFTAIHVHTSEMWPGILSYSHVVQDRRLVLLACSHPSMLPSGLQVIDPGHSPEACAMALRSRSLAVVPGPPGIWARPLISSHGEILGTMTFQAQPGRSPSFHQEAFEFACNLAGIAINNRRLYEEALHRSQHDQLTGLANRALLDSRIEDAIERARASHCSAAVLFLDLDKFKVVNDTWSHRIGDLYLCEVARRFQACLREGDTLGRVGGDEFIAVIGGLEHASQATAVARRLLAAMHTPIVVEGIALYGTVSIGMAIYPEIAATPGELKHEADAAMYDAKHAGGDQIASRHAGMSCELTSVQPA